METEQPIEGQMDIFEALALCAWIDALARSPLVADLVADESELPDIARGHQPRLPCVYLS